MTPVSLPAVARAASAPQRVVKGEPARLPFAAAETLETATTGELRSNRGKAVRLGGKQVIAEALLVVLAYLAYSAVRVLVEDHTGLAFANAARVLHWESVLHLSWELQLQLESLHSLPLTHLLNAVYSLAYWPTLILSLVYLFARHRQLYRRLRSALVISGLVGLVLFAAFPLAPPRLAAPNVTDTIAAHDPGLYAVARPHQVTNQYAAMPSFHFGWTLICSACVVAGLRRRVLRLAAAVLPLAMGVAVITTGNHYLADVIVGGSLTLSALGLTFLMEGGRLRRGARRAVPPP